MEETRLRVLTQILIVAALLWKICRNGRNPIKGIDTLYHDNFPPVIYISVEMEETRLRVLTQ